MLWFLSPSAQQLKNNPKRLKLFFIDIDRNQNSRGRGDGYNPTIKKVLRVDLIVQEVNAKKRLNLRESYPSDEDISER